MNNNPIDNNINVKRVKLPKPNPGNITSLTPNLPNKPILPWNKFDSPWLNEKVHKIDKKSQLSVSLQAVFELLKVISLVVGSLTTESVNTTISIELKRTEEQQSDQAAQSKS